MKQTRVATRYAKSLLGLAEEQNKLEEVYKDMQLVAKTCKDHAFALLLKSPIVKSDKKQQIFNAVFAGELTQLTSEFISIINRKRREMALGEIAEEFLTQYNTFKGITIAVVTSAAPLDDATKKKVLGLLKTEVNGEIQLIEKIDAGIIGGFIVRIGDRQIDASLSRRLTDLRGEFSRNRYVAQF